MKKLFTAAGLLLALFGCAANYTEHQMSPLDKPGPKVKNEVEGNTSRYTSPTLTVEASYLTPDQADLYFSIYKDGKYKNPFVTSQMVFQLSIENRGKNTAVFNPGLAWVYPDNGKPSSSRDYTNFYADLALVEAEDIDERVEAFKASSFDGTETIPPGASVKKLIVFTRSRDSFASAAIILENIYCGKVCETVKLVFPGIGKNN